MILFRILCFNCCTPQAYPGFLSRTEGAVAPVLCQVRLQIRGKRHFG